METKIIHDEGH